MYWLEFDVFVPQALDSAGNSEQSSSEEVVHARNNNLQTVKVEIIEKIFNINNLY